MKQSPDGQLQKFNPVLQAEESLLADLHTRAYEDEHLRCMMLYEKDPLSLIGRKNLLYVKVIILTWGGRKMAQYKQQEIIRRYGVDSCDSARFIQAFAKAMTLWDCEHEAD